VEALKGCLEQKLEQHVRQTQDGIWTAVDIDGSEWVFEDKHWTRKGIAGPGDGNDL
jgi:hypothetical protein